MHWYTQVLVHCDDIIDAHLSIVEAEEAQGTRSKRRRVRAAWHRLVQVYWQEPRGFAELVLKALYRNPLDRCLRRLRDSHRRLYCQDCRHGPICANHSQREAVCSAFASAHFENIVTECGCAVRGCWVYCQVHKRAARRFVERFGRW